MKTTTLAWSFFVFMASHRVQEFQASRLDVARLVAPLADSEAYII